MTLFQLRSLQITEMEGEGEMVTGLEESGRGLFQQPLWKNVEIASAFPGRNNDPGTSRAFRNMVGLR
jgi:hypothetical protein